MTTEPVNSINGLRRAERVFAEGRHLVTGEPIQTVIEQSWNQYRFDKAKTGSRNTTSDIAGNLQWSVDPWGDTGPNFPAAVADGVAFCPAPDGPFAINTSDQSVIWHYKLPKSYEGADNSYYLQAPLSVANNTVYFGTISTGRFYAIDAGTGELKWMFDGCGEVESCPTYKDGVVYFGSNDGSVYALDAADGTQIWSYETWASNSVNAGALIHDGVAYTGRRYIEALDVSDGTLLWDDAYGPDYPCVIGNGMLFVSLDGEIRAYDIANNTSGQPETLWTQGGVRELADSPAYADGKVVYCSESGVWVEALDATDGSSIWRKDEDPYNWLYGGPVIANGNVYYYHGHDTNSGSGSPKLKSRDLADGSLNWEKEGSFYAISIANDTMYVNSYGEGEDGSATDKLRAYR